MRLDDKINFTGHFYRSVCLTQVAMSHSLRASVEQDLLKQVSNMVLSPPVNCEPIFFSHRTSKALSITGFKFFFQPQSQCLGVITVAHLLHLFPGPLSSSKKKRVKDLARLRHRPSGAGTAPASPNMEKNPSSTTGRK